MGKKNNPTPEQDAILKNDKKRMIVSASAGSGKTYVIIEYLIKLIVEKKVPVKRLLVLTFTKAAANEMRTRLIKSILEQPKDEFLLNQLDDISISDITTIDAYCEKLIKRNINALNLDENFIVLDEKISKNLKLKAFNKTFEYYAENDEDVFDEIYFAYKKNKDKIFEALTQIQDFFDSQDDWEKLFHDFCEKNYSKNAKQYLLEFFVKKLNLAKKYINASVGEMPSAFETFKESLWEIVKSVDMTSFDSVCKYFVSVHLPAIPRNKIEDIDIKKNLVKAKDSLLSIMNITDNYKNVSQDIYTNLENNTLSVKLLLVFKKFYENYIMLKNSVDGVDFADLEKLTKTLLGNEKILNEVQDKYDYIFIDEYQDTNMLQASIVKPISEKGHFIAVGDPKQGIYGFRNATMEIMTNDIKEFSLDKDSNALFLKNNFRSDQRVLSFINMLFEKIMTEKTVGIDYSATSKLNGLLKFQKVDFPSVTVDIVDNENDAEKKPYGIYSVKNDSISVANKYKLEVDSIITRVEQLLNSTIYDSKQEVLRKVKASDIAILFRSRGQVMKECVKAFQEKGFNVSANIKQTLLDDGEILVLTSLLKLILNLKDDISLVSVMASFFGGMTLEEISQMRIKNSQKYFYESILSSDNDKIVELLKNIKDFKFDYQLLGLTKALRNLFVKFDYYLYLHQFPDSVLKLNHLQEFFKLIKNLGFDNNVAGFIDYLENNDAKSFNPANSPNSILITTIHATKGLEYPIVILAGCGENLAKPYNMSQNIESEFGVGTYLYDYQQAVKVPSPVFLANKYYKKRREFIDEIMIFYVALTRARNHLLLIGSKKEKDIAFYDDIFESRDYIDMVFNVLGENFVSQLFAQGHITTENYSYNVITDFSNDDKNKINLQNDISKFLIDKKDEILNYIDYQYKNREYCKINYKNSVTGILNLEKQNEEKKEIEHFSNISSEKAITQGLAYHEALLLLEFEKVCDEESLDNELNKIKSKMTNGYFEILDKKILLKNILLLNSIIKDGKMYKEKQFLMAIPPKELGNIDCDDDVIIQGIIDLFILGKENILIDYKFSSISDSQKLVEKYKTQLLLYSLALKKGFNVTINKVYLLSLKNAQLIKVDL